MPKPPRRPLGRSGLSVAPVALGGNVFGWTVDEKMGFRLLEKFVSAGFNLIDTADVYSVWAPGHHGGESETILGNWLHESGRREEVLIATKVGMDLGAGGKGLSAEHITRAVDDSLRRLRTDHIDLYQAHIDDLATPLDLTLGAFGSLLEQGKVRAIGASNYAAARLSEALQLSHERGLPRYEVLQPKYNLMDRREYEESLEPVCRANGLGVITYSSLASGFLTGKYRSPADLAKSPRGARAGARLTERGLRILAALDGVAGRIDSSPATVALAWLMARPTVTAPIVSATSLDQLDHILDATSLNLDRASMRFLEDASREPT